MCVFLHGEKVAQDLGRVGFVGQSITHWQRGIAGKLFHFSLRKSAILAAIIHPAQDPGSILHGFLAPDMGATWAYVGDIGPLIECCNLESAARSRRVFFKDEGKVFPFQALYLCSSVFRRFHFSCHLTKKVDPLDYLAFHLLQSLVPQTKPPILPPHT